MRAQRRVKNILFSARLHCKTVTESECEDVIPSAYCCVFDRYVEHKLSFQEKKNTSINTWIQGTWNRC